jgi:L,D-transpeptidase ErfK/SrfK
LQRDCGSSVLTRIALACLLIAAAAAQAHAAALFPPASQQLSGAEFEYTVESGDTLMEIAARYGVTASVLAVRNGLKLNSILAEGNRLAIDNRHVVPVGRGESIIINVPQRMLFHFGNNSLAGAYPIAVGLPTWRTPLGEFTVAERRRHPVWRVPPSIQREMREQGRRVRTVVAATIPWGTTGSDSASRIWASTAPTFR